MSGGPFGFLSAWRTQRGFTLPVPGPEPEFPERFRGRPSVVVSAEVRPQGSRALPVLDLGASLFSPEESAGGAGRRLTWTHDTRMASRSRDGLVSETGQLPAVAPLEDRILRLVGRSLRLRSVAAGSCNGCEGELVALGNVVFDLARFGVQFVASPRHADGIVISGTVNVNMREALERTYAAVPDPRIVIAVGACAASGGPFAGGPEILGIPASIPVDLWIPGCPPHPLTLLDGLLRLLGHADGIGAARVSHERGPNSLEGRNHARTEGN